MSYSYWVDACEFRIAQKHHESIHKAAISSGHYDADDFDPDITAIDFVVEILNAVGFDVCTAGANGDVVGIEQTSSSLSGDVEGVLGLLAPYVADSSYINCRGEDGYMWRWRFVDGKMYDDEAYVVYATGDIAVCPVQKIMGGKNACAACPFGLVCLCGDNPRLQSAACSTCGGGVILDTETREIVAGVTCTCHKIRFVERKK